jgi:hypothetical protein
MNGCSGCTGFLDEKRESLLLLRVLDMHQWWCAVLMRRRELG